MQCKLAELRSSEGQSPILTRDILGGIYLALKKMPKLSGEVGRLAKQCAVSDGTMKAALKVFEELGLVLRGAEGFRLAPTPKQKLNLEDSETYRKSAAELQK